MRRVQCLESMAAAAAVAAVIIVAVVVSAAAVVVSAAAASAGGTASAAGVTAFRTADKERSNGFHFLVGGHFKIGDLVIADNGLHNV